MSEHLVHEEIRALVTEIESLGFTVVRDTGKHPKVLSPDGKCIYSLPSTPGRGRWKQNLVAELTGRGITK